MVYVRPDRVEANDLRERFQVAQLNADAFEASVDSRLREFYEQFEFSDDDRDAADDENDDEWSEVISDWRRVDARTAAIGQHVETMDRAFDKFTDIHIERIQEVFRKVQVLAEGIDARCACAEA